MQTAWCRLLASPLLAALGVAWCFTRPACAQPMIRHVVSVESLVLNAEAVVVGRIVEFARFKETYAATIAVETTLKGEHRASRRIRIGLSEPQLTDLKEDASRLLVALSAGESEELPAARLIDLSEKKLAVLQSDFTVLRAPEDVLRIAGETIRRSPGVRRIATVQLSVPYGGKSGNDVGFGRYTFVEVPVDAGLEQRARAYLTSANPSQRMEAVQALRFFKSEEHIARVKALLQDTESSVSQAPAADNDGIEIRVYPVRQVAYETLTYWGVNVTQPVFRSSAVKLDEVRSAYLGGNRLTIAALRGLARFKNLDELSLQGAEPADAELMELAQFTGLRRLALGDVKINDAGIKRLAPLKNLRSLELGNAHVTDAGLSIVGGFRRLEYLYLNGTHINDAGLKELAGLDHLAALDLTRTRVTAAGLKEVASLMSLNRLDLDRDQVTDATLRVLREAGKLHLLSGATAKRPKDHPTYLNAPRAHSADEVFALDLREGPVTAAGLRELGSLVNLEELILEGAPVRAAGLKQLSAHKKLATLILWKADVSDDGLKQLANIASLRVLDLGYTRITDAGLGEVSDLKNLTDLRLVHTGLTDEGLKSVAKLKQITLLWIAGTKVTDAGLKELAALPNLKHLNLSTTAVTDAGVKDLAAVKSLLSVHVHQTKVTDAAARQLRKALPRCEVSR